MHIYKHIHTVVSKSFWVAPVDAFQRKTHCSKPKPKANVKTKIHLYIRTRTSKGSVKPQICSNNKDTPHRSQSKSNQNFTKFSNSTNHMHQPLLSLRIHGICSQINICIFMIIHSTIHMFIALLTKMRHSLTNKYVNIHVHSLSHSYTDRFVDEHAASADLLIFLMNVHVRSLNCAFNLSKCMFDLRRWFDILLNFPEILVLISVCVHPICSLYFTNTCVSSSN